MVEVPAPVTQANRLDAIVVGAGIAGLYMLYRLRELGLAARVFEAGAGVGGTWYWNRYPGARCDVESLDYSYSFSAALEQEWEWTERFPTQAEILRYLNHVADRFELRPDIQLNTRVTAAHFQSATAEWAVQTDDGQQWVAPYCIMAVGCLSAVNRPAFEGLETFTGRCYYTARWPEEAVEFGGQRVGVIGTGSSGVQAIPQLARQARELYVFQRTPNYSIPAHNQPLDAATQQRIKADYPARRQRARLSRGGIPADPPTRAALETPPDLRQEIFEQGWQRGGPGSVNGTFNDLLTSREANELVADFVRGKIRATVHDPAVAELLVPTDYPFGTKRLCIDIDYFETYNRPNVTLVDLRAAPIERIIPTGLRTTARDYELDSLVFATGFDAITGPLFDIDIRGQDDVALRAAWAAGPRAYLGLATAGFPNLFLITGPGSPSVLSNMIVSIEQHVEWIAGCLGYLRAHGQRRIEATEAAQEAWVAHVQEVAGGTLYPLANSWYLGANIPGKPRVFMPYVGGVGRYRQTCDEVAAAGYRGFALSPA
jgi:cyclohexanone monooxygenase